MKIDNTKVSQLVTNINIFSCETGIELILSIGPEMCTIETSGTTSKAHYYMDSFEVIEMTDYTCFRNAINLVIKQELLRHEYCNSLWGNKSNVDCTYQS